MRTAASIFLSALVCLTLSQQAQAGSHTSRIKSYAGPETCVGCHTMNPVEAIFNSAHFQLRSTSPYATTPGGHGLDLPGEGAHGMQDRACGLPGTTLLANNYAGIATSPVNGATRGEGCGKCHPAYRPGMMYQNSAAALPEIDCLICHSPVYGAEWEDLSNIAVFGTNGEPHAREVVTIGDPPRYSWSQDRSTATARLVGYQVTNRACERCHEQGMSGYKRSTPMRETTDVHSAAGMLCTACHITNIHKIARGNQVADGVASDAPETDLSCSATNCHGSAPHTSTVYAADLNRHTDNVRCGVCHINSMEGVERNIHQRGWGPSTWDPILKKWEETPATTSGLEYPNYWDAYTVYYPSIGPAVGRPDIRWFDGVASLLTQPYGDYSTRASAGGKAKLQAFKYFLSGMLFDAAFLPGPPTDGSFDLVNGTWSYSQKWFMEQVWPIYLQYGFIDSAYPTPGSYWAVRPDMAMMLNLLPHLLQFDRSIFQTEGGTKVGNPPSGPQSAISYPGLAKAINSGMGALTIGLGLAPQGSDPIAVGSGQWSGQFFSIWGPANPDQASPLYGEAGSFVTQSHAVKANFGENPCAQCHCGAESYYNQTCDTSTKYVNFKLLGYPDSDGNTIVDRMYDLPSAAAEFVTAASWSTLEATNVTYILPTANPVLTPGTGTYTAAQTVTFSSSTPAATICYTTDGTTPTRTNGTQIPSGGTVVIDRSLVVKAFAFSVEMLDSGVTTATYAFVASFPKFSPLGGTYFVPQNVVISTATVQGRIRYTTDGSTPTATIGTDIASDSVVSVDRTLVLKAVAYRDGWIASPVVSGIYTFRATLPVLSPLGGTYAETQNVTITSATPEALIRYTTDGATLPTDTVGTPLANGGTVVVNRTLILRAIAYRAGWTPTLAVSAAYTLKAATPVLSPYGATYYTPRTVTITTTTPGAQVSYTTDGTTPSQFNGAEMPSGGAVLVDRSLTLKAVAYKPGWTDTAVVSGIYTFRATAPVFAPLGGTFSGPLYVTITAPTENALIRYTTDGTVPTRTVGTEIVSGNSVYVNRTVTFRAIAYKDGWVETNVITSLAYSLKAEIPVFTPLGGTYFTPQTVTITTATVGGLINYTTDGTLPTRAKGTEIASGGTVRLDRSLTLKAVAYKPGWTETSATSSIYTFKAILPVFAPLGGIFSAEQSVTITSATPEALIRYTTDGTTLPTPTTGTVLTNGGTVAVNQTMILRAIAYRDGWVPTGVVATTYTLKAATPAFAPVGGTYFAAQSVTITSATTGTSISYTTDGTTPSQTNGAVIPSGGAVLMDRSMVIRAVAYKPGWTNTAMVVASYSFKVTTPAFSLPGGTYLTPQDVTITSPTLGALIHYTTDGSLPTPTYGIELANGGTVPVARTMTLKAIAYKDGCVASLSISALYSFKVLLPTFTPAPGIYYEPQSVTISTTTPGALIRYTTDGTIPTPDYGLTLANGGMVTIGQTLYLRAMAYRDGWISTSVLGGTYTIKPPL